MLGFFHRAGPAPAFGKLAELVGATSPPPAPSDPQRLADLAYFLGRDIPAMRAAGLAPSHVTKLADVDIIPAGGQDSRTIWNRDCADALAGLLGTEVVEFPGGHSLSTHTAAFAERLDAVLSGR